MERIDITNKKFGLLTARNLDHSSDGKEYWLCECECGRVKTVRKSHLLSMRIRSCGCLYSGKKRGQSGPNTYMINGDVVCGHDFKRNAFFLSLQDFELVRPYKWYQNHDGYVVARIDDKNVTMHQFLFGQEQTLIDHQNRNKADNRRENIRTATPSENGVNRIHTTAILSGFIWVDLTVMKVAIYAMDNGFRLTKRHPNMPKRMDL